MLPPVATLADAISESEFPLEIDTDWDWGTHSGWLPMHWDGEESGCEVDFEPLEQSEIDAAEVEGFSGLDSVVIITTRGWDSLTVANAFAACLVKMTDGCISEDEDEFLAATDAFEWARRGVEAAEQGKRDEAERAAVNDQVRDNLDDYLKSLLTKLVGRKIAAFGMINDSRLAMRTEDGPSVGGSVWTLQTPDRNYDVTRFARVKDREDDVLFGLDSTPEDRQLLETELERADQQDEEDKSLAWPLLDKWAEDAAIVEARWLPPHTVEVTLSIDGNPKLIFSGKGYLANVIVREGLTEVHVEPNGLRLFEIKPG
jgi:hypothetical protein